MRWMTVVAGLALLVAAGCKQQCFITECDYQHYRDLMPAHLDVKPQSILPDGPVLENNPTTVFDPDRPIRWISLCEAIAITLERGNVGDASANNLLGLQGIRAPGFASDNIRVLALNPAIGGAAIDLSLSKFDAVWNTSTTWNNVDRPVGTPLDTFQTGNTGVNAIEQAEATFNSGIVKPLPTGGVAGITFNTDYQLTNLPARVNPSYRPSLQFQFEQPLLQGFGVEINQIRGRHPGNLLTPGRLLNLQPTQEGILLTRLRFDQDRAEFERRINLLLLNVESSYWTLYGAYWTLFAQEQALRQSYEAWRLTNAKFQAGQVSAAEVSQARAQYELFRSQRLAALGSGGGGGGVQPLNVSQQPGVLEAERQLRNLLNLPIEDGHRLVPSDSPTLAPYRPDWNIALNEALALRPELVMARQELKVRQLALIEQKNNLLPDLRVFATYDSNAIGTRLDGGPGLNAFSNLASNHFNNWQAGINLNVPIGFRQAHAQVRIARLNLAQSWALLKEQELRTQRVLAVPYRSLFELHEQIGMQRSQREALAEQLRVRFQEYAVGRRTLDVLLEAQRLWANALSTEVNFVVQYNIQLANFEFSKGTILQHNNVQIAEGPLPHCAQVRAVEHERMRSKALVLRERPSPDYYPECAAGSCEPPLPKLPDGAAPSLVDAMGVKPPLPQLPPEKIKLPREIKPEGPTSSLPPLSRPASNGPMAPLPTTAGPNARP